MRQLSPLTHRTSIRFCTQSCGRIKRRVSLRDVSIGIADRSPTSSSTYCLPDSRGRLSSKTEFIARVSHLLLLTFVAHPRGILSKPMLNNSLFVTTRLLEDELKKDIRVIKLLAINCTYSSSFLHIIFFIENFTLGDSKLYLSNAASNTC